MTNEVKFKYGDASAYAAKLASEDGVDASALYFVSKDISTYDGVDFGGTIYRGNDALGTTCADHLKTVEDIQIVGGPLANNVDEDDDVWPWKDDAGNMIIPAGKSIQEILTAMFLKPDNGTVKWGSASWSPTIAKPTVTLSSNGPVEVGSTVKISALSAGNVAANKRSATCTCKYGYFNADASGNATGAHQKNNKTISVDASISGTATLTCTWNGKAINASDNLVVGENTNTVKATQTGQTAVCEALPTTKVFAATNTKTLLADVSATFSETKPTDIPLSSENIDTIKAYYPIYTNGKQGSNAVASTETALVANDATKLALVADNTSFYVNFAPMIDGGTGWRLLIEANKTITFASAYNVNSGKYDINVKSSFVKANGTVKKLSGDTEVEYVVYEAKGTEGANNLQIKID